MGRRTSLLGAIAKAHARSVREAEAQRRAYAADQMRRERLRAAEARAEAAEVRAADTRARAHSAALDRAVKQAERARAKAAKEAERDAHDDAAESARWQTMKVSDKVDELRKLLAHTLSVDDCIKFDDLLIKKAAPVFVAPVLKIPTYNPPKEAAIPTPPARLEAFLAAVRKPAWWETLFRTKRYQRSVEATTLRHEKMVATYEAQRREIEQRLEADKQSFAAQLVELRKKHELSTLRAEEAYRASLAEFEKERSQRELEVAELQRGYSAGEAESVEAYNTMVLERSDYPSGFPQQFEVAYVPESKQLVIDYELPTVDIVPPIADYRYVKSRKSIEEKLRKPSEIKEVYRDVVAQIALRTLHEVFEADQGDHIQTAVFSGYIHRIDETTGHDARPYLISVRATKAHFLGINLARVEPQGCLKNLGASVSPSPEQCQAVKPIIEFDMVDARFVEQQDVLNALDSRPNLMELSPSEFEALVSNLFGKMGLETRLTRASKDGGVDAVAFDTRPVLGGKIVIQAKRYRHTVGVSAVRDLYGTMMNEGASKGILVTTSGYGPDAFEFAKDKPLELIDGGVLLYHLESIGRPARIVMPTD